MATFPNQNAWWKELGISSEVPDKERKNKKKGQKIGSPWMYYHNKNT